MDLQVNFTLELIHVQRINSGIMRSSRKSMREHISC